MTAAADDRPTGRVCPECEGEGTCSDHSPDGATHRQWRCDLCGGDGWISQAQLRAWKEAQRLAPRR
jgi:DnaJ-class molecular chaperone